MDFDGAFFDPEDYVLPETLWFTTGETSTLPLVIDQPKDGESVTITHNLSKDCFFTDIPKKPIKARKTVYVTCYGMSAPNSLDKFRIKVVKRHGDQILHTDEVKMGFQTRETLNSWRFCAGLCAKEFMKPIRSPMILRSTVKPYQVRICTMCIEVIQDRAKEMNMRLKVTCTPVKRRDELTEAFIVVEALVSCSRHWRHEASCYCAHCNENFCYYCFINDHSHEFRSNDYLIPIEEKPAVRMSCGKHKEADAVFACRDEHCENSNQFYCHQCLSLHQNCERKTVESVAEKLNEELEGIARTLDRVKNEYDALRWFCFDCARDNRIDSRTHKTTLKTQKARQELYEIARDEDSFLFWKRQTAEEDLRDINRVVRTVQKALKRKENLVDAHEFLPEVLDMCKWKPESKKQLRPQYPYVFPVDDPEPERDERSLGITPRLQQDEPS